MHIDSISVCIGPARQKTQNSQTQPQTQPPHQLTNTKSSTLLLPQKRKDYEGNYWEETLLEGCLPLFRIGIDSSGIDPR